MIHDRCDDDTSIANAMSFFGELKRRNVLRVAAAYVAFAWVVVQVVEVLFPVFGLGDQAIRIVVILLAIGFVPAVVTAWAFELTPEGFRREAEVDHDSPVSRRMTRRLDRLFIVALALALGFFAFDKFVLDPARDAEEIEEAAQQAREEGLKQAKEEIRDASIAVLAFQDLSPGGDQEYFADGLAVDLISQLGNVPALRVTGKASAFSFKGKDATIPEIGEALNVAHILDGTVSRSGDRVRVSVQLLDARQDRQLWSETYDRILEDIFDIRDEIAMTVFDRLTIEFERLEQASLRTDPEVYDLTLQARHLFYDSLGMSAESQTAAYRRGAELLARALAIDPEYVPALLLSIGVNYGLLVRGIISEEEEQRRSDELIQRVLTIDPDNGIALGVLAWEDWEEGMDLESAAEKFSDALRTAPGDLELTRYAGMYAQSIGRSADAIALLERCVATDPRNLNERCPHHLARAYLWGDRLDDALDAFRELAELEGRQTAPYYLNLTLLLQGEPEQALTELELAGGGFQQSSQGLAARAMIMHDLGRDEESEEAFQAFIGQLDEHRATRYYIAQAYAWTGQTDSAFEWLDKAYALDQRYGQQGYWFHRIMFLPIWRNLHDDPRWDAFRVRTNMSAARLEALEFSVPEWLRQN